MWKCAECIKIHYPDCLKKQEKQKKQDLNGKNKKTFMLQEAMALWKQAKPLSALPGQPFTIYLSFDAITRWFTS